MLTEENKHIGFILFAGEGNPFEEQRWEGDCIFTGVPSESETFEHSLVDFLYDVKHQEFNAIIESDLSHIITISSEGKVVANAEVHEDSRGYWQPMIGASSGLKGCCVIPANKPK